MPQSVSEIPTPSGPSRASGRVRAVEEKDIPQITELHQKAFGPPSRGGVESLRSHLLEVFCRHPWRSSSPSSLVYEDTDGRIVGSLGVVPRRMWAGDRPVRCAVSHNFMVEPGRRSTMAAIEMLKHFFAGPQDLSIAEGNDSSRRMWERMGGETSAIHSLQWIRPLRPARYLVSLFARRFVPSVLAKGLRPLCDVADWTVRRMPAGGLRVGIGDLGGPDADLDAETLQHLLTRCSRGRTLRPDYDLESLEWLLGFLARRTSRGTLQRGLVRDRGESLGWYLYYVRPGGLAEVVQLGASSPAATPRVLGRLFEDAWKRGAVAVSGQLEPSLLPALSQEHCLFRRGSEGTWLLFHSRQDDVLRCLHRGDVFLTRLEGEWWIGA